MDLDGIAIFVKVMQAGSFSRAAKLLGMPNSTVSAKVSALERRLGVTLLQRTTRALRATQAGEIYFHRCVRALEELQAAELELTSGQREAQGLLRLTAPVEIGHSFLATLVHAFLRQYPLTQVDLVLTNRIVDLVGEGIDLAIRGGKLADSRLIARRFTLGHFALWASPTYLTNRDLPAHPKDLSQHECIRFALFKEAPLKLSNGKQPTYAVTSGRLRADDFETVKALALLGAGIAYLPEFLCAEEVKQNKLQRLLPEWHGEEVVFSFVYPAQKFVPPKVRGFIEVAEKLLKMRGESKL
jgi:DNA-binding transcriptional LysR family regulator